MWLCDCVCGRSWGVLLSLILSETFCLIVYVDGCYEGDGDLSIRLPCTPVLTRSWQIELFNRSKNNWLNVRWLDRDSISRRTKLTVFWFWRSSCLGAHWKICFKFLFARSCSFLQSVFVMLASESTTTMCCVYSLNPTQQRRRGWEPVKSKRFLFWRWHKNREIFTRTNYMMTFCMWSWSEWPDV